MLSQTTQPFTDPVPIRIENPPADVIVLSNLGSVTRITLRRPAGPRPAHRQRRPSRRPSISARSSRRGRRSRSTSPSRRSTTGSRSSTSSRGRSRSPSTAWAARTVPIEAVLQPAAVGPRRRRPDRRGGRPRSSAGRSRSWRPSSRSRPQVSIDAIGRRREPARRRSSRSTSTATGSARRSGSRSSPPRSACACPVFTDRRSKTLPVTPIVIGTPAAGFEVASVDGRPVRRQRRGRRERPGRPRPRRHGSRSSSPGASSRGRPGRRPRAPGWRPGARRRGPSRSPSGCGPVTATRTFEAGLVLVGARPDRRYELSTDRVLVTIGGSVADLDRLVGDEPRR